MTNKALMRNRMKNTLKTLIVITLVTALAGCDIEPEQSLPERNYELIWNDEFDGDSGIAPDASKWSYDIGTGTNGWGNNELQTYTKSAANVSLTGNGMLMIRAIKSSTGDYTSARLNTSGIFSTQYGRIEARIKTPTGSGIWPAFWMLGNNIDAVGWPQCGEIDILEQNGKFSNITYGSLHGPGYSGGESITTPYAFSNKRFDTDFYVYAVEWRENTVDFFVNDLLFKRLSPDEVPGEWVYNHDFFLILNLAVGGNFVGSPNDNTPFPATMLVDYVRVYREK